jgi:hypothetical protein
MNRIIVAVAVGITAFLLALLVATQAGAGGLSLIPALGFAMFVGWAAWAWPRRDS